MTGSTAGLEAPGRCDWLALIAADPDCAGDLFATAAAVAMAPGGDPRNGVYGVGVAALAGLLRHRKTTVRANLERLVSGGWLEVVRPGGGRSTPTLYALTQPALMPAAAVAGPALTSSRGDGYPALTGSGGHPYAGLTSSRGHPYAADTGSGGNRYPALTGSGGHPYYVASPLLGVLSTYVRTADSVDVDDQDQGAAVAAVLERLPEELRPRTLEQTAETARDVAGWLAAGWTADAIGRRARAGLRPGPISYPPKILRALIPPRPPANLVPTPGPGAYVRDVPERLDDDRRAQHAAGARQRMREANARARTGSA